MNKNIPPAERQYVQYVTIVTSKVKAFHSERIMAINRREAVLKALTSFWYKYRGSHGPAHKALVVTDPYNEVHYGPKFICSDRMNKFLPEEVIVRLIAESKGELTRDTRKGSPHNQPNSLRRVKRRRDFGKHIAPSIKCMRNGVMYYRVQTKPQRMKRGRMIKQKKYRDIRLNARTLEDALAEIETRGLRSQNVHKHKIKVRDIPFTKYVCGLTKEIDPVYMRKLGARNRKRVRVLLRRYDCPQTKALSPV